MTQPGPCDETLAAECARMADAIDVMAYERQSQGSKAALFTANGMREAAEYVRSQAPVQES